MLRFVTTATCLLLLPTLATAQADPEPKDGKVTIKMSLHPTAAPVPLFKLHLYPEYSDLQPGNRVQGLLKCFMEQDNLFRLVGNADWQKGLDLPLSQFPGKAGEQFLMASGIAYGEKYTRFGGYLDKGARYKSIEWNEYFDLRHDGYYLLLPEVQKIRQLSQVLRMRLRAETKAGEFDKCAVSVQSLFGVAQALEQHPCLIGYLVGAAIGGEAVKGLEEMVQQPGCPNLFWALTDVPQPALSLRTAVGGERIFLTSTFEKFHKPDRPLGDREIDDFLNEMNVLFRQENEPGGLAGFAQNAKVRFALIAADTKRIDETRKRLTADGAKADVVKSLPDIQVAILDDFRRYEILRDETFKAYHLPYHEAAPWIAATEDAVKKSKVNGDILGPALLPAVWKVKQAQARLDQRIALLRVTEAIRLFAHENGGNLPATLADVKLPLPNDPYSGKPFAYEMKDGTATLHGADVMQGERGNRWYEMTVKK